MNKLLIGCMAAMVAAGCCDCSKKTARKPVKDVKFVVLDPGHFHAALVLNRSYEGVEKDVRVFAPEGPDVAAHKKLVDAFNSREKDPTSWNEVIYTGADYLEKALASGSSAKILAAMARARETVDALEHVVDDADWPLPKYREMLFLY